MKLHKHMQWLKEHLTAQMTEHKQSLWDRYEDGALDVFIEQDSSNDTFEMGWELGSIEMLTEVLEFIDTLENPTYGDV